MVKNLEQLNQADIFADIKLELNALKKQVTPEEKNKIEKGLYNIFSEFKNKISNSQLSRFNEVLNKLKLSKDLTENDIKYLESLLGEFEVSQLKEVERLKLREELNKLQTSKNKLKELESTVEKNVPQIKEIKSKIEKWKNKLESLKKDHPIWFKAMLLLLPAKLVILFKKKSDDSTTDLDSNSKIGEITNKLKSFVSKIEGIFAQILVVFFSWLAPKEIQDALSEIKKDFKKVNPKLLEEAGKGKLSSVVKNIENSQEFKKGLEAFEAKFKKGLGKFVNKYFGKKLTKEQEEKVLKHIDLKKMYSRVKDDKNYVDKILWGMALPGYAFLEIILALYKEKIVNAWDITKSLFFIPFDKFVEYGKKSILLIEGEKNTMLGKVPLSDFEAFLGKLYNVNPEGSKIVLFNFVYRAGGGLLRVMGDLSVGLTSLVISTFFDNRTTKDLFKNVTSSLKGKIDYNINKLLEVIENLPEGLRGSLGDKLLLLKSSINQFVDNLKLVEAYNLAKNECSKSCRESTKFYEKFQEKVKILDPTLEIPSTFKKLEKTSEPFVRSTLVNLLEGQGKGLDKELNNIKALLGKSILGDCSKTYVINYFSKRITTLSDTIADTLKEDSLMPKLKSRFKRLKLFTEGVKLEYASDRLVYRFKDVKSFEDFTKNLKTLAHDAPWAIKDIIGHAPIFAIAGIDFMQQGKLSDKIKNFGKDLSYLLPFVGPFCMIRDASWQGNINLEQISMGVFFFSTDVYFAAKALRTGEFLKFMVRPITDTADAFGLLFRIAANSLKMGIDSFKVIASFGRGEVEALEFAKSFGRAGLFIGGVLIGYEFIKHLFGDKEDDYITYLNSCTKDKKVNLTCFDEKIKQNWNSLSNSTRSKAISLAYELRTGNLKGVKTNYVNGEYKITLDKDYGYIPSKSQSQFLLDEIANILKTYGEKNPKIGIDFTGGLVKEVCKTNNLNTKKSIENYFGKGLGYEKSNLKTFIKVV